MTHQFPAAFRRLCVETANMGNINGGSLPAAFRRLCVETNNAGSFNPSKTNQPPSGGCVLKL